MFRLLITIVLATIAAAPSLPAAAAPLVRYESSGPGALTVTGNTLGLAGDQDGPGADDRIGVFTDADLLLQVEGWPLGTTDDWRLASSEAVLDLPVGATVLYAELVWGGSFEPGLLGDVDGPVVLTLPSGASIDVAPDALSGAELGAYYGRSADVTTSIVAAGRYRVGAVPASLDAEDAAAGWALYVVYTTPNMLPRRVAVVTFMQSVTGDGGAATASIGGLCPVVDPDAAAARLSVTAIDGDANIAGDVLSVARAESELDDDASRVSVLGAADDNVFGGRLMDDAGGLDERGTFGVNNHGLANNVAGARQGWDVVTGLVGERVVGWQDLWLRDSADNDQHGLIAAGIDVDMRTPYLVASAEVAPENAHNGLVRVVIGLDNRGALAAVDPTLRIVGGLPAGVSYVADSFTIDGVPVGAVDFAAGVDLGDLAAGVTEVAFELELTATSGTWSAVARVTYDNGACAGAATVPAVAPALSFTFEDPVEPEPFCGDGTINPGETCDDGEVQGEAVDGCSATCRVDRGWACLGEPSNCRARCGDGLIALGIETCDDGNRVAGDGCATDCSIEIGYACRNEPSVCSVACGDGRLRDTEACDDGNLVAGDGCGSTCRFEPGWLCSQPDVDEPTACEADGDEDGVVDPDDNCPEFYNPDQSFPVPANLLCPIYDGPRTRGGGGCDGGDSGLIVGLFGLLVIALRRRVALLLVLLSMPARAQEIDPRGFEPTLSPLGVLGVETSATVGHLRPWVNLVAALADDELSTQTGPEDLASGPVDYRFMMTFSAGLGLFDFLDIALGFPVTIAETSRFGEASSSDMGMTDLRVLVRGRLLGPPVHGDGFGLAVAAHLTFPTGSDTPYMSDGAMTVLPQLVMDYRTSSGFLLALNVGYRFRPERQVDDLVVGNELRMGLGAEIPVGFYGFAFTGEVDMAMNFADNIGDDGGFAEREVPVEVLGGMRWRSGNGLTVTGAVGSGITAGYGAPDFRVLFGVAFNVPAPEAFEEPIVPASRNERRDDWKGRKPADTKKGPAVSVEAFDRLAAMDPDADSDGVPIPGDMCPAVPEDRDGFKDEDGCPDPDNDEDGVFDVDDKCPNELETLNGVDDYDGCHDDPKPVEGSGIKDNQIEIKDRIRFKQGSAELLPSDMLILDQVAAIMRANPNVKRFRIEGHTDNLGNREFNVDLAERRAWSVRSYLVTKGIEDTRMFAKGYGSTRPIAKNTSDAGRAQNRRVEFHIVRDGEPWEGNLP